MKTRHRRIKVVSILRAEPDAKLYASAALHLARRLREQAARQAAEESTPGSDNGTTQAGTDV